MAKRQKWTFSKKRRGLGSGGIDVLKEKKQEGNLLPSFLRNQESRRARLLGLATIRRGKNAS
jgi:hypothetical protein